MNAIAAPISTCLPGPLEQVVAARMRDAQAKAWDSLSKYKFAMFGYWAAAWLKYATLLDQDCSAHPFQSVCTLAAVADISAPPRVPLGALGGELEAKIPRAMSEAVYAAWGALREADFEGFGRHAADWVKLKNLLPDGARLANPFSAAVKAARFVLEPQKSTPPE